MSTTSEFAYGPPPPGGFYAYRPIVVPADLDALRGPLEGVVQIPAHIDTSARAWYDLADRWDREMLYRIVILEAWEDEDFAAWLNRDALVDLWPEIHLPRPVRAKWEAAHPVLAARGAGRTVPQPQVAIDPFQADVARIALDAAGEHGFALAGGNALVAHGVVARDTEDVDLFSPEPGGAGAVAEAVCEALRRAGYTVAIPRPPQAHQGGYARLEVTRGAETMHVDLARDWRRWPPVMLDVHAAVAAEEARAEAAAGEQDPETPPELRAMQVAYPEGIDAVLAAGQSAPAAHPTEQTPSVDPEYRHNPPGRSPS